MVDLQAVVEENIGEALDHQCMEPDIVMTLMCILEVAKMAHAEGIVCKMTTHIRWEEDTTEGIEDMMIMADPMECHHKEAQAEETPTIRTDTMIVMSSIHHTQVPINHLDMDLVTAPTRTVIDSESKEMMNIIEEGEVEENPIEVTEAAMNLGEEDAAEEIILEMNSPVTAQKREKTGTVTAEVAVVAGVAEADEVAPHHTWEATTEECLCIPEILAMMTISCLLEEGEVEVCTHQETTKIEKIFL